MTTKGWIAMCYPQAQPSEEGRHTGWVRVARTWKKEVKLADSVKRSRQDDRVAAG